MNIEIKKRGYDTQYKMLTGGEVIQIPGYNNYFMAARNHYIIDIADGTVFAEENMNISRDTMVTVVDCKLIVE